MQWYVYPYLLWVSCLTSLQQEKNNRPAGGQRRGDDQQYNNPNFSEVNTQRHNQQQQQVQVPNADADPYAAYGGYDNYLALWYTYQQTTQQNLQAQGPPGS